MKTIDKEQSIEISVFKTNIHTDHDFEKIALLLDKHEKVSNWTLDREDADKVLRIQTTKIIVPEIIHLIKQNGFLCEELPD
jgi:hypothetical protein